MSANQLHTFLQIETWTFSCSPVHVDQTNFSGIFDKRIERLQRFAGNCLFDLFWQFVPSARDGKVGTCLFPLR